MTAASEESISNKTSVQIGLLTGLLATAIAGTWGAARSFTGIENTINDMQRHLTSIDASLLELRGNGWSFGDMKRWSRRFSDANPEIEVPEPWDD